VIQKQKSQVRQYLSESFQQTIEAVNGAHGTGDHPSGVVQVQSAPTVAAVTVQNHHVIGASPDNVLSPSLSSVATSTDEVTRLNYYSSTRIGYRDSIYCQYSDVDVV
jgi:hypothetical protein